MMLYLEGRLTLFFPSVVCCRKGQPRVPKGNNKGDTVLVPHKRVDGKNLLISNGYQAL
jgi:hypothetical protein